MTSNHNNQSHNQYPQRIDRTQAITQLELLGFHRGEAVYVRAFLPKEDPRYAPETGRKADLLNWEQVERWQAQGYGIYIVVNGGGHADKDVLSCRAVFIEHDDLDMAIQRELWRTLGLPEPTFQVQTRKSVHSYWVFETPIPVDLWRQLQADLLSYTGADPAIKNPSRVMRLAGAYHMKPGHDPLRCDIIHQSAKRYSYEELRAVVPVPQPDDLPLLQPLPQIEPTLHNATMPICWRYEDILVPVPQHVPLEVCLSKESRALVNSGVSEGGRNNGGAKLARDLIGTASYLQAIGQGFHGDPRRLLDDYASRCTPPLPPKEVDGIWKSAEKDRPSPSCKAEGVEACIRGWYWNNHREPLQPASNGGRAGRGFGSDNMADGGNGGNPPLAALSVLDRIREILNRYDQESLQVSALMSLAGATGRTYNEISQLARIIRAEGDLADEVIEAVKSLQGTLNSCRKRLDIQRYLEPALASALIAKAAAMPTAPEYLFNTLLAASASRIGTAARVIVKPEGGYKQPCIFWTANVSHSGQAKTPPQQEIIYPLEQMEAVAKELHDVKVADYEQDGDKETKSPVRQRRLLNNVTTSTKIRIHEENPKGLLEYIDELVADYQRLNQYKSGKGDDLQLELSFWNGSGGNYDRSDVRLFLKKTAFSKTGTYQWDTLARLMADEVNFIASGYSARFLYCSILDAPPRYLDLLSNQYDDALQAKLTWLYSELEQLSEADYLLEREAKVLFQGWNHALVNAEIEESHFGLSLVYAKIEACTARLALWLHLVNAILRGEKPKAAISGETMQNAIEIASFYLWQHKLIHAHNSPTRKLEGIFLKVQTLAEKFFSKSGKGMGASFAKSRINSLKNWVVEKIRCTVFKTLADAGHGQTQGEGTDMVYIPNTVPGTVPPDGVGGIGEELVVPPIAETTANTGGHPIVGEIGDICTRQNKSNSSAASNPLAEPLDKKHQFTNLSSESFYSPGLQAIGINTNPPPTPPIDNPPGGDSSELLSDEEMAAWRSRLNACQTLDDATDFCTDLDILTPSQRHQFELTVPESRWAWLWNLPQSSEQELESLPSVTESEPQPVDVPTAVPASVSEPQPEPTLEALRAMLLACDSLVQLQQLKRSHKKNIGKAYRSMTETEQTRVDAIAALAVPHRVFKYLGDTIVQGTVRLLRGTLVYLEPSAQVKANTYDAPVWALDGIPSGWKRPLVVSLSLLQEVNKSVKVSSSGEDSQQLGLI